MKNRIVKKVLRIIFLVFVGVAVVGTFYFLWKKAQPVITLYELVTPARDTIETKTVATGKVEPRDEVLIKPQMSGIISELLKEAGQMVISKEDYETSLANYKKAQEEAENAQDALEIIREGISKRSAASSTTQVRSTITGMILDVPIKVGNSVIQSNTFNDGTTIATVADMSNMIFRGKVDETEVGRIHEGMPIKLTVGAMESRTFDAELEYVAPKGVEENGAVLFEVKAAVHMPGDAFIRAGYSANAEIVLKRAENVLSVPESCVEFSGDSTFVQVVKAEKPEQKFEKRAVKVGLSDGIKIEIKEGLAENEKVRGAIVDPNKK